jgi:cytochrome d ubiquinol oxidase subunit II
MAPEILVGGILWLALALYVLLGGADFGAGIWEVNLAFQATPRERLFLQRALGPVWEANHVWLIFVLVVLWTAFPPAFAALSRALWLPFLGALVGIFFRGAAFAFRTAGVGTERQQAGWGILFALASTLAPFFLGAAAGAIARGRLAVTPQGAFQGSYWSDWLSPLAIFTGFFTVGICAYLAAVYLTWEAAQAGDGDLAERWRPRALATGMWMGALALAGLVFLASEAPPLWSGFRARAWPMVLLSLLAGFFSLMALGRRRFAWAVGGVVTTVLAVLGGWGLAQYPYLLPPALTLTGARSPETILWAILLSSAAGAVLLLPSLAWLLRLFKGAPRQEARPRT